MPDSPSPASESTAAAESSESSAASPAAVSVAADEVTPRLEIRGVSKSFPGVQALRNVSLRVMEGEVLSVVGENGAGKSTLMKIMAGVQPADSGELLVDGTPVRFRGVTDAMSHGIALIHQELNLCDNLSIAANMFLGREPASGGWLRDSEIRQESARFLERVGLKADPDTPVGELTIGRQQLVEIARALSVNARVLIMDEPTSSLSAGESERLFEVIRELRDSGVSIVYISHRLAEVEDLSDRVTVLRDGENAGDLVRSEVSHDSLVRAMIGRDVSRFYSRHPHPHGKPALEARELRTRKWPQHRLSFTVRSGEVVGVAGLVGAGRTEMLEAIFGVDPAVGGTVRICDREIRPQSPEEAISAGMALVPEDRKLHGVVLEMSIRHNIGLPGLRRHSGAGGLLNRSEEDKDTRAMVDRLRVRTPGHEQLVVNLSGGNQQKVVLGKWLALKPDILLLDEPTRGIDVGAKQEIYQLIDELAGQGMAILFVSSEMEEIIGMSDRALVMHEGRLCGELTREELTEDAVMHLATGSR